MPPNENQQQHAEGMLGEGLYQINIASGARDFAQEYAQHAVENIAPGLLEQDKLYGKVFRRFLRNTPEKHGLSGFDSNRLRDRKIISAMVTEGRNTQGTLKILKTIEGKFTVKLGFIKHETNVWTVLDLMERAHTGYHNFKEDSKADLPSVITESGARIAEFVYDRWLDGIIVEALIAVPGFQQAIPLYLTAIVAKKLVATPVFEIFEDAFKGPITDAMRSVINAASHMIWQYDPKENTFVGRSKDENITNHQPQENIKITFPNPVVQQIVKQMQIKAVFHIPEPQNTTPNVHLNITRQGNEVTGVSPSLHIPLHERSQLIFAANFDDLKKDPKLGFSTGYQTPIGESQATLGIHGGISHGKSGFTRNIGADVTHPDWKISGTFSKNASAWLLGLAISSSNPIGMAVIAALGAISSTALLIKESRDKRLKIFTFLNYDKEFRGYQPQAPRELALLLREIDEGFIRKTPFTAAIKHQLVSKIDQCDRPEIVNIHGQKILQIMKYTLQHTNLNPIHDWYTNHEFEPCIKLYTDHINRGIVAINAAIENNDLPAANKIAAEMQKTFPGESLFADISDKLQSKEFLQQHYDRVHCLAALKELAKPIAHQSPEYIETEIKQLSTPLQLKFALRIIDHYDALKEEISSEIVNDAEGTVTLKSKDVLTINEVMQLKIIEEKQFELNSNLYKVYQASDQIFFKYAENCINLNKFDELVDLAKKELSALQDGSSLLNIDRVLLCRNMMTQMAVGNNDKDQCLTAKIFNDQVLATAHITDVHKSDCHLIAGNLALISENYHSALDHFQKAFKFNPTNETGACLANMYCAQENYYQAESVLNSLTKTNTLTADLTERHQDLKSLTYAKTSLFVIAIASRALHALNDWLNKSDSLPNHVAWCAEKLTQLESVLMPCAMLYFNYQTTTLANKIHGKGFTLKDVVSINAIPMAFSAAYVMFGMLAGQSKNKNTHLHTAKHVAAGLASFSSASIAGYHLPAIFAQPDVLMLGKIVGVANTIVPAAMLGQYVFDHLRNNGDAPTSTLGITLDLLSKSLGNPITATVVLALNCPDQAISVISTISTMNPEMVKEIIANSYDQIIEATIAAVKFLANLDPWIQAAIAVTVVVATILGINNYSYNNYVDNGYKKIELAKHKISENKTEDAQMYLSEAQQCVNDINYYWQGDSQAQRIEKLVKVYLSIKDDHLADKNAALFLCDAMIQNEPDNQHFRVARSDLYLNLLSKGFKPEEQDIKKEMIRKQEIDVQWLLKNQAKHPETWIKKINLSEVQAKYVLALHDMQEMKRNVRDHNNVIADYIQKAQKHNDELRGLFSKALLANMINLIDKVVSPLENANERGLKYQQEKSEELSRGITIIESIRSKVDSLFKYASADNPNVLNIFSFESQVILKNIEDQSNFLLTNFDRFVENGEVILKNIETLIAELKQNIQLLRNYNNEIPQQTKEQLQIEESKQVVADVDREITQAEIKKESALSEQQGKVKIIINTFGDKEKFRNEVTKNIALSKTQLENIVKNNIYMVNAKQLSEFIGHLSVLFQHLANDYARSVAHAQMLPLPKFTEATDAKVINHAKHQKSFINTALKKPLLTLATRQAPRNPAIQINTFSKIGVYDAKF